MPRLVQPPRTSFSQAEDLEAYDAVVQRRRSMKMANDDPGPELADPDLGEYFGALLNSPRLCAICAKMGTFVRTVGEYPDSYSHADREFVDQVLSVDWKTNVVQALHVPDAVAAGVRLEAIEALRSGHEEDLNEDEQLLARFIRQTVSGTVDDDTFRAMHKRLGSRGIVDYSGFILWLQWIIRMMQMIQVDDPSEEEIDAIVHGLRDGSVPVPDFRQRLG
jgi:hypothetical protein